MGQFFALDYSGPGFELFGPAHLAALAAILALNLFLIRFKGASEGTKQVIRWTLALVLWADEAAWHLWNAYWDRWNLQTMLPLNMCSILIWASGFMLIFKSYRVYEFAY